MQEQITDLQTKYSYQEDMLQELNQIVIRQQQQLDEMLRDLRALKDQLSEVATRDSGDGGADQQAERPPHY